MALVHKNRVKETSTTTGTGTYTLAGAVTGYQAFSAIGNANTCYYVAEDGTSWEVGVGTYTLAGTTLARTTIHASSNAGSAVNWAAGTRNVFVGVPAEKFAGSDEAAILANTNTFTGRNIGSINGAVSAPAWTLTGTPYTGGSATTTKPLALVETAGATSAAWSTSGTMLGVNAPSGFVGNVADVQLNGTSLFKIGPTAITISGSLLGSGILGQSGSTAGFSLSYYGNGFWLGSACSVSWTSGIPSASPDLTIRRRAAANLQLGAADAAAPVAQTLGVQSVVAGTTNTAGTTWTLTGSLSTGSGLSGDMVFKTGDTGAAATAQNAAIAALTIKGGTAAGLSGSVIIGSAAIATAATDGFLYIPTCAGTPTGVPTAITGLIPMIYDTTNDQFWFYRAGWKQPKTPAGAAIVTWQ